MMDQFINRLETLLNQYDISDKEKKDIMDDYKQMIEDGIQRELSEEAIIEMVGTPEEISKELGKEFNKKKKIRGGEKIIALTPFISFIIFMALGLTKGLWHPTWIVFLIIPVTAIIVEMINEDNKYLITALSPFVSGTIFFLVGFLYNIWHPTWLIFLIIPMFGIINSKDEMDNLTFYTALSPFVSLIAFILIGHFTGAYHLAWLVLLLVVFLGIFHEKNNSDRLLLLASLVLSIVLYLVIGKYVGDWTVALFSFLIFIITGLFTNHIQIDIVGMTLVDKLICIVSLLLFLGVGYFLSLWVVSWLFLLIIPVAMIIRYNKSEPFFTPLTPFVSVTIFMLLGYFLSLWHISWIALLLIPIVAIIENA